ncbi:VSK receptor, partial [Vibrio pectenicida]|nr:VSK receptor [Vibrio pectenicida]
MDWIVELFNELVEFLYRLIISLVDMLKDLFLWAIEQIFGAVKGLLNWVFGFFSPL